MTSRSIGEWQRACARLAETKHKMDLALVALDQAEDDWHQACLECERLELARGNGETPADTVRDRK